MLSKIAKYAHRPTFSKITTTTDHRPTVASQLKTSAQELKSHSQSVDVARLQKLNDFAAIQKLHYNEYVNEVKGQSAQLISINFEDLNQPQVLVLQSAVGENNWKLAELITLGGTFKLLSLLAGFPSYAALVGVLGVTGLGAALSYSNYLRRSTPQITEITHTKAGKFHIFYLKPGFIAREEADFQVEAKSFSYTSFGNKYLNFLHTSNNSNWVSVDGNLFWYNNNQGSVRINSQLYHKLL